MKRNKIYNLFQINQIVFYSLWALLIPILLVISYIFDLHNHTSTNNILLVSSAITMIVFVVGQSY